jgi:MSHA biogenesis protein MshP
MKRPEQGLGMITAIIILVIMASLAGAMVTFGNTQQLTSAQDVMSVKAWQAAKAGNEWGLYMALNSGAGWVSGTACTPSGTIGTAGTLQTRVIDLATELGFSVTVTCSATKFNEGEVSGPPVAAKEITLYTISSTATNGTSVASPGYVERSRVVTAEQ